MDCPRCRSHVPDTTTQCPVCYKPLTGRPPDAHFTLTGEIIEGPPPPSPKMPLDWQIPNDAPDIPAPVQRASAPLWEQIRQDRRWLIVLAALAGMLICLYLLLWPPISLPVKGLSWSRFATPDELSPIFHFLFAGYVILGMLTILFLPAPWRSGLISRRQNWVLTSTAMLGFFLFFGVLFSQIMSEMHAEHVQQKNGVYGVYQGFTLVREISAQEYQSLAIERYWNQMENLSCSAAGALLACYAGIAGYGAWWLLSRPDWHHPVNVAEEIGNRL